MLRFYLRNEFFFSLELRRHTETTFHFGHLHDNKCKEIIRPEVWRQQIHCNRGAYFFPDETFPEEFVSRTARVIALRIPTVYHFTRKMHAHIREQMISCSFFLPGKKDSYRGFGDIIYISCLPWSE